MIAFNLCLLCERHGGAWWRRRNACGMRLSLIRMFASWRLTVKICDLRGIGLFTFFEDDVCTTQRLPEKRLLSGRIVARGRL